MFPIRTTRAPATPGQKLFGAVIVLALGFGLSIAGIWTWRRVRAAEGWPTVQGVVETSEVKARRGSKGGTTYTCEVTYHFSVAGVGFQGTKRTPTGNQSESSSAAAARKAGYSPGGPCTVHYDPADPSTCCLELGTTTLAWILFGFGGLLLFIGTLTAGRAIVRPGL